MRPLQPHEQTTSEKLINANVVTESLLITVCDDEYDEYEKYDIHSHTLIQ